jgi:hypothetical protein
MRGRRRSAIPTPSGGSTTAFAAGFAHGPASLTATALSPGGLLQLVTPARVNTSLNPPLHRFPIFGAVRVRMVPEPGLDLLLGAGIAGLALIGHKRMRP